jgi:hypothetical protein
VPLRIGRFFKENDFTIRNNAEYLHPLKLWLLREGDCNDFSIFAYYVLKKAGYQPSLVQIFWPQGLRPDQLPDTHDICVYHDMKTGRLNYFDQDGLHAVQTADVNELAKKVLPECNKAIECSVKINDSTLFVKVTPFRTYLPK